MMTKQNQVPVTVRATIARINRKLAHEGEQLRTARGDRSWSNLGNHYIVDVNRNFVVADHVEPEKLARELGVLRPWEVVADGGAS